MNRSTCLATTQRALVHRLAKVHMTEFGCWTALHNRIEFRSVSGWQLNSTVRRMNLRPFRAR